MRKPHPKRPKALGVDIGRVIIDGSSHPDGGDTAFFRGDDAAMLATPEMTGAIESISRLAERFEGRVWLVSKCGPDFIDDRIDVHRAIHDVVDHRFLFGEQRGPAPDFVVPVADWTDAEAAILDTLAS